MPFTRIALPVLPWELGAFTPLERKKTLPGQPAALLEFAPGFADPSWCTRAHAGLVLDGALAFDLDDGRVEIAAGEAFLLDAGTRHRALNPGAGRVRVFVVSPARLREE